MSATRTLAAAALLSLAGSAPAQTPTVFYELSWKAIPSNQSFLLQYGDYAQVVLTARVSPPVGTVITLPDHTTGTVAGLGDIWFDLQACDGYYNNPQWTLSGQGFQGTTGTTWGFRTGWTLGFPAAPQPDSSIQGIQCGQFLLPGQTANATNPVVEIWRGKWMPQVIQPGVTTRFTCSPVQSHVYIKTGSNPDPVYVSVAAAGDPSTIQILHDPGAPGPCFAGFYAAPPDQHVLPGQAAVFSVPFNSAPPGCPAWVFQWHRGCTWLQDGGNISGAHTTTLRIDPVAPSDAGFYVLAVGNWQGSPNASRLTVGCYANCDNSTDAPILNVNDFQCFINKFAAGDNSANCDGSTAPPMLNANDFQCFLNKFAAGCS